MSYTAEPLQQKTVSLRLRDADHLKRILLQSGSDKPWHNDFKINK